MSLVIDRFPVARSTRDGTTTEATVATAVFWVGLGVLVASAWWFGRGLWFYSDEWNVLAAHHDGNWTQGFNGQWLLIPTAIFRILLEVFGLFTYWPYRLVGLAIYTSLIVVFHTWARRRVRPAAATLAALAIAWYSTSWNVVMMPLLMNFTIPCVMLFLAWMLLERNDAKGDAWVAVALAVGMLSSNVGLVVCVIIGVEFLITRAPWRRWLVFVPAAVVWVPWFLIWYEPISKTASVSSAVPWGFGLTENYAKAFFSGWRPGQWIWLAALTAVFVWALWRRRWNGRSIGVAVGLAFFVAGASFRVAEFHIPIPPDPNWYLWFYSVLVTALVVELARDAEIPLPLLAGLGVVVAIGGFQLHGSLADFHRNGLQLARNARTWYAAADALGERVPRQATLAVNIVQLPAGDYADLRADRGSLAPDASLADLGDEGTRQAVDAWMLANLGTRVQPGPSPVPACRGISGVTGPSGSGLPPGVWVEVDAGPSGATLRARRFAAGEPSTFFGQVGPGQTAHFTIPTDHSDLPWHLYVDGADDVRVCG